MFYSCDSDGFAAGMLITTQNQGRFVVSEYHILKNFGNGQSNCETRALIRAETFD